jgi:IclR family pca regulon transcriptional regulator
MPGYRPIVRYSAMPPVRLSAKALMDQIEANPDFVLSLARGLQVIEAFQGDRRGLTVSDIAERTQLSRAAVRRLLLTLEMLGYAQRQGPSFYLTSRILRLGFSFVTSNSLAGTAQPVLEQLSARIHESCSVSVLEGDQIVYVARSPPKRVMTIDLGVGSRLPAYCTSMGRVLLAAVDADELDRYLASARIESLTPKTAIDPDEIRRIIRRAANDGFALVDEELELGLRSIAVPVTGRSGKILAAMNSGVSASRVSVEQMTADILPALRDHARLLGQLLT